MSTEFDAGRRVVHGIAQVAGFDFGAERDPKAKGGATGILIRAIWMFCSQHRRKILLEERGFQ